jgi:hypothetical protein
VGLAAVQEITTVVEPREAEHLDKVLLAVRRHLILITTLAVAVAVQVQLVKV